MLLKQNWDKNFTPLFKLRTTSIVSIQISRFFVIIAFTTFKSEFHMFIKQSWDNQF